MPTPNEQDVGVVLRGLWLASDNPKIITTLKINLIAGEIAAYRESIIASEREAAADRAIAILSQFFDNGRYKWALRQDQIDLIAPELRAAIFDGQSASQKLPPDKWNAALDCARNGRAANEESIRANDTDPVVHAIYSCLRQWEQEIIRRATATPRQEAWDRGGGFSAILVEVERARAKFPSPDFLLSALSEEHGEVVQAVLNQYAGKGDEEAIRKEIIQEGAMLYRLATEGDPVHRLNPTFRAALVEEGEPHA
jgi:hypothetical protein